MRDHVVLDVRIRACRVEALFEIAKTGDLLDELRIGVPEISLDGRPMLGQLLRIIDDPLLIVGIQLEELVLRRDVQLDDGEENIGMKVQIAEAMLEQSGVLEKVPVGQVLAIAATSAAKSSFFFSMPSPTTYRWKLFTLAPFALRCFSTVSSGFFTNGWPCSD